MKKMRTVFVAGFVALLGGCASTNSALFVTSTEVGIGADAKPAHVNIGYDRTEGFIGPAYPETGGVPPVVGRIQSNLQVFTPKIKQVYATGEAAKLVVAKDPADVTEDKLNGKRGLLTGKRRLMFFGTSTNIGLKMSFTGEVPDSIIFGYKRKEMSFIPLREADPTDPGAEDKYASVLASIDMDLTQAQGPANTELAVSQFIATGEAAERLAKENDEIRMAIQKTAMKAVQNAAALEAVESITAADAGAERGKAQIRKLYIRCKDANKTAEVSTIEGAMAEQGFDPPNLFFADGTPDHTKAVDAKILAAGVDC